MPKKKGGGKSRSVVRSAVNGRFVKKGEAKRNPRETVTEKIKPKRKK